MLSFLRWTLAALTSIVLVHGTALAAEVGAGKSFKGPTGLQLYSLRDIQKEKGVPAMLDTAKAMGFKYVELAGTGELTPAQFKAELDRRGLVPIGGHFSYEKVKNDLDAVVAEAKALGLKYAGVAYIQHTGKFDEKLCREAAAVFNRAGDALAKEGMKFYYHNHGYEFDAYKDGTMFDLLLAETNPKTVLLEMDVLWTYLPGQDPVKLLEKYPDRWVMIHLKDLRKGVARGALSTDKKNDVAIGTGQIDWPAILKAGQKIGVKYYFIEDESPSYMKQIPQTLKYLESIEW